MTVDKRFRTPEWRTFRTAIFVGMGSSAVVPVVHGLRVYGVEAMEERIGLTWLVSQFVLYLVGAGIYAVCSVSFGWSWFRDRRR